MPITLAQLAQLVGGQLHGDGQLEITGAATAQVARSGEITLADTADRLAKLTRSQASAVIIPSTLAPPALPSIAVADVHAAFTLVVCHFHPPRQQARVGISVHACIEPTAKIAADVDIHAGATIGADVEIAAGCTIHSGARLMAGCKLAAGVTVFPNAVLYDNTVVGAHSIIHAGTTLGAYGFGYKLVDGRHQLSAQLGWVELGEHVEVGANTTIDRGTYGATVIGDGTKIDNQVMIAHNCRLGRHNMICSQVGIAGSTTTGDYVVMAGQVGVRDHVHIGDRAVLGAMAGVVNDVPSGAHMLGAPAIPEREQKMHFAVVAKLPEMRKQLKALQREVDRLAAAHPELQIVADDTGSAAA